MTSQVTRTRQGLTSRTVLTNAQVKALPTTPVQLIPPQGTDRAIVAIIGTLELVWVADYTNLDADSRLFFESSNFFSQLIPAFETHGSGMSAIFAAGIPTYSVAPAYTNQDGAKNLIQNSGYALNQVSNLGMILYIDNQAAGNLTGGDPGNSLIVTVFYNVVKLGV